MNDHRGRHLGMTRKWRGGVGREYWFYRAMHLALKTLGLRFCYAAVWPVTLCYVLGSRRARRASVIFQKRLGKGGGTLETFFWTWMHFRRFGESLLDRIYVTLVPENPFRIEYSNREAFAGAMRAPSGVLVIGAHVGNFELGASLTRQFSKPMNLLMLQVHDPKLKTFLESLHEKRAYTVIDLVDPVAASQKAALKLEAGEAVCVMGDRDLGRKSATLDFLGAPVRFPLGPFLLASFAETDVFFVFCVKEGKTAYRVFNPGPFRAPAASNASERLEAVSFLMKAFVFELEKVVRRFPDQWFNFFDFWEG